MQTEKVAQTALTKALATLETVVADLKAAGVEIEQLNAPGFGNHSGKEEKATLEEVALKDSLPLSTSEDNGQTAEQIAQQEAEAQKTDSSTTASTGTATGTEKSADAATSENATTATQEGTDAAESSDATTKAPTSKKSAKSSDKASSDK